MVNARMSKRNSNRIVCAHHDCGERLAEVRAYEVEGQKYHKLTFAPFWKPHVFGSNWRFSERDMERSRYAETRLLAFPPTVPPRFEGKVHVEEGWTVWWSSIPITATCPSCGRVNLLDPMLLDCTIDERERAEFDHQVRESPGH